MGSLPPRVVVVTRKSEYDTLLASHGTRGQVAFFLQARGQALDMLDQWHASQIDAVAAVKNAVPKEWSTAEVTRSDLDRFLFTPDDYVVAVGQDGLVANLARYLNTQPVFGVAPALGRSEGVLTSLSLGELGDALRNVHSGVAPVQNRTMVQANIGAGQTMLALNELFVGHRSHQSARYEILSGDRREMHSSSGVIVSTGTGLTGWALSVMTSTTQRVSIGPEDPAAAFFCREPWPSHTSTANLVTGIVDEEVCLKVTSRMETGGVIFSDGIEQDFIPFNWGTEAQISIAERKLNLFAA